MSTENAQQVEDFMRQQKKITVQLYNEVVEFCHRYDDATLTPVLAMVALLKVVCLIHGLHIAKEGETDNSLNHLQTLLDLESDRIREMFSGRTIEEGKRALLEYYNLSEVNLETASDRQKPH